MLKSLFGFVGRVIAIKDNLSKVAKALDRADDDLDGDGKSELENLKEELTAWGSSLFAAGKDHFLRLETILERAHKLEQHIEGK